MVHYQDPLLHLSLHTLVPLILLQSSDIEQSNIDIGRVKCLINTVLRVQSCDHDDIALEYTIDV